MENKKYDKYKLIVFEQPNFGLIAVVEYYKKGKKVDTKRSVNNNFIIEFINQAIADIQKIKIDDNDLIINTNFEGQVIVINYQEVKKGKDFFEINAKVEQVLSKKENIGLVGIKNLKVTTDKLKFKKVKLMKNKFLKPITLAFIITSQIIMINNFLPEYKLPFNNDIKFSIVNDNDEINISNKKDTIEEKKIIDSSVFVNNVYENNQLTELFQSTNVSEFSNGKAINHNDDVVILGQMEFDINKENSIKKIDIFKKKNKITLKNYNNEKIATIKNIINYQNEHYKSVVPTYQAISYNNILTDEEFNQLVAMVESEAGGYNTQDHYTDALAITSIVLNRLEDENWRYSCGDTIMEQVHASDQFVGIQRDVYKQIINNPENASPEVVQAVKDCLSGTRNNPYLEFRGKENKGEGRIQFVEGGNNYFGLPKTSEVQNNVDQQVVSNIK